MPAHVAARPASLAFVQHFGARDADITELMLVEAGEGLPGAPARELALHRRLNRQSRIHDPAEDVIVLLVVLLQIWPNISIAPGLLGIRQMPS